MADDVIEGADVGVAMSDAPTRDTMAGGELVEAKKEVVSEDLVQYISKHVSSIVFSVLSPQLIKKMSSAKIVTPELYDREGYPVDGGLMDVRLGVIDPGLRCKTCGSKLKECNDHFGYIELARAVVHVKFVPVIATVLRCSCKECGHILIPKEKLDSARAALDAVERDEGIEARRKAIKTLVGKMKSVGKCPWCKAKQGVITLEKPTSFLEDEKRISPVSVRARLERVPDDQLPLFGLNAATARPEWMILTVLAIPPVTMRPSITLETGERSEDDLTHKLSDIVRINQRLFENINAGAPEIIIEDLWDLLQYHVTTFFDNAIPQVPPARHRSGPPLKTLTERIKSKEGRIRHNLAGKRTNFCARTVVSPDPFLRINEVGVPLIIAMKLTVPDVVTPWNMAYLKKFVEAGSSKYPGCNYVVRPDGRRKKLTEETKEAVLEEIQPGYVIERHLMDGDIVLFNRQPSLHRMSMMSHKVKVLPDKTFRLNPTVCAPYNADFDGDEMNLHVPQTEEAKAEADLLMDVKTQVVSPRYGLSIIGCLQDSVTGNFLLTQDGAMLSRERAVSLLASIGIFDFSRLPSKKFVSGREVFSVLMPDDFDFVGSSKSNASVRITKGALVEGIIDEANLGGEGAGLLLRALHYTYGSDISTEILFKIFSLGNEFLQMRGFSTGLSDADLPQDALDKISDSLKSADVEVDALISVFNSGKLEVFPGRSAKETLELKILEVLNRARNQCGSVVKESADPSKNILIMSASGARGSNLNLSMMTACVGQQALRGRRITKGYSGRTLSCFKTGDFSSSAHGFIRSNFKIGLNPKEFFFGAITGRDSLMDTALRTPKSGYLYRRLANALQDLKVEYDGSVRDATGKIIQFSYGEDGIDVSRSDHGTINVKNMVERV